MKSLLILLATISIARANLIDLTPGGFDSTQRYPQPFLAYIGALVGNRATFFDSATPNGFVSRFGALNGGTYFQTSLIGNPGPTADVSWDFTTLPGWSMTFLLVEGEQWIHVYGVGNGFNITDLGDLVTLHDNLEIKSLSFAGRNPDSAPVPDSGSTAELMGFGMFGLFFFARRIRV